MDDASEQQRWASIEREQGYIRATLRLLNAAEGGRQTPIASGYRSHWSFPPEIHDEGHDAPLTVESGPEQWLDPGVETPVRLHPLFPRHWPTVAPGLRLNMMEGARLVGIAEVVEVIPPSQ